MNQSDRDPASVAFANSLRQTSLQTVGPDRDRLMYLCGQASASTVHRSNVSRRLQSWWPAVVAATLCFLIGNVTGASWFNLDEQPPVMPSLAQSPIDVQSNSPSQPTVFDPSSFSSSVSSFEREQAEWMRSGEQLFSGMTLEQVESLPETFSFFASSISESSRLRSGMPSELLESF